MGGKSNTIILKSGQDNTKNIILFGNSDRISQNDDKPLFEPLYDNTSELRSVFDMIFSS